MLQQIQAYVYERRHGFSRVVGFAGCMYLLGHYVQERLEEMREQVLQDKFNRDNLRRRFLQNRQDTNFIVMTLLTKLGENILEEMDVEGVTNEIQAISRASKRRDPVSELRGEASTQPESNPYAHTHGHRDQDTSSDIASISGTSFGGTEELLSSPQMSNSETTHSWVDEFTSQSVAGTQTHGLTLPSEAPRGDHSHTGNSPPFSVSYLSDSVTSASASDSMMSMSASVSGGSVSASDQGSSRAVGEEDLASSRASTRTKAELWREVKILTFTRTLTIIYSTTLLSLLTHIQLALVGRSKYVQSVIDLQQDEKLRDYNNSFSSSLGFGSALVSSLFNSLQMFDEDSDDSSSGLSNNGGNGVGVGIGVGGGGGLDSEILPGMRSLQAMNEYTEKKFLTLSWWLLHAGWKDVAERVRKSVEEVFDDVSLKSKLGIKDIHQLICDVRRRVECEITYEGVERRINFSSSMIPPTEETLHRVLISGGIPPSLAGTSATTFTPNTGFSSSSSGYYPSSSTSTTTPLHPHFHSQSQSQSHSQSSQAYTTPAPPDPAFASLLDETRKIVVSKEFADVLERSLDVAMEVMVRGIARGVFKDQSDGSFGSGLVGGVEGDGQEEEEKEEKVRLAGLLPGLARWNHMIVNALPNELADTLADQREMIGFAAMIFSSYDKLL